MSRPSAPRSPHTERFAAAMSGASHYFSGVPCKRGHLANRYVTSGACVDCVSVKVVTAAKNRRPIVLEFPLFKLDAEGRVIPRATAAGAGKAEYEEHEPPSDAFVRAVEAWVNDALPALMADWSILRPTEKCGGMTLDEFRVKGWSEAQLVEHGYATRGLNPTSR